MVAGLTKEGDARLLETRGRSHTIFLCLSYYSVAIHMGEQMLRVFAAIVIFLTGLFAGWIIRGLKTEPVESAQLRRHTFIGWLNRACEVK